MKLGQPQFGNLYRRDITKGTRVVSKCEKDKPGTYWVFEGPVIGEPNHTTPKGIEMYPCQAQRFVRRRDGSFDPDMYSYFWGFDPKTGANSCFVPVDQNLKEITPPPSGDSPLGRLFQLDMDALDDAHRSSRNQHANNVWESDMARLREMQGDG